MKNQSVYIVQYLKYRVKELLRFGARLRSIHTLESGDVAAMIDLNDERFCSVYILNSNRGKGAYIDLLNEAQELSEEPLPVITVTDCKIDSYLSYKNIPFKMLDTHKIGEDSFAEYDLASEFWEDRIAKRTGVPFMLHVDEGLAVLNAIGATERAMRIYALHGVLQQCYTDDTVHLNGLKNIAPDVIIGAMEYRAVANAHLSFHDPSTLRLSEDPDVNAALVADKVQNRKDFEIHHKGSHKRSDALDSYFKRWLRILDITEDDYYELAEMISSGD
jgi:hypothetical protein